MRKKTLALAGALFMVVLPVYAQTIQPSPSAAAALAPLTLPEALSRASLANPALRAKQAQLAAAQGALTDARALLYNNPQISLESARRQVPVATGDQQYREWTAGVAQAFETGGQRGYRREATSAALEALRYEIADMERQVRAEVTALFFRVLALQQRVELESQALKLFEDAAGAVQKRRRAGEDTKLDANVALVEAERARNQFAVAQEQLLDARGELSARLQLAGPFPQAQGDLNPIPVSFTLDDLLGRIDNQPRLLALVERERSAASRLRLEKASVAPDITVGIQTAREGALGARERINTVTVSIPLPLFRRNAAGIGQAATEATQAEIQRQAGVRDARAGATALWLRLVSQEQRVRRLQESVLPALTENLNLSLRSRQAGQIGLLELIVVNRQALDARRDLIEALVDYHATRANLELAAGWPPTGSAP